MNWKSINSEQSYYTIAKTSHIQQRIMGKKWKGLGQSLIHPPPSSQHNTPCICWGMLWPWPWLCFNIIPTFVCTVQHERQINAVWNDVWWSTFFNGTTLTTSQEISQEVLNLLVKWDGEIGEFMLSIVHLLQTSHLSCIITPFSWSTFTTNDSTNSHREPAE